MPRLNLVDPEEMPAEFEAEEDVPEPLKQGRNVGDERRVQTAPTHRGWENNPEIHEFHNNAFLTLWREDITGLTPRETELVIVSTARAFESNLEWNVHVGTAIDVGMDEDDIRAIYTRSLDELDEKDAAVVEYASAFSKKTVTDQIHENLAEHYDDETIVGIMELAGFYALCCLILDAMGCYTADPDERFTHLSYERLAEEL